MDKTIQSILEDLFQLDPDLKKVEGELIPLLEKLVATKPKLKLDEGFVANLRNQLMIRADELSETEKSAHVGWFARYMKPLMGGSVAFAALVIGLMVWKGQIGIAPKPEAFPALVPTDMKTLAVPETEGHANEVPQTPLAKQAPVKAKTLDDSIQNVPGPTDAPTLAPEPMLLQALPSEEGADTATPPSAPKATLRESNTASAGISNVDNGSPSIIEIALRKAQAGERKITADSAQVGFRSPQEMLNLNFDNLPNGFEVIQATLPAGTKAFVDMGGGTPEYYIYFEKTFTWYGPF